MPPRRTWQAWAARELVAGSWGTGAAREVRSGKRRAAARRVACVGTDLDRDPEEVGS